MLSIGKSHLITDNRPDGSTLSIRPIRPIRRMDTNRNVDFVERKIASHYSQQTQGRFNVVDSTDSFDSSNGHDPKPGCCRSENRISLLTTDPAVQRCRSTDSFDSSNGHDPKRNCCRSETRISLVTTCPAVDL